MVIIFPLIQKIILVLRKTVSSYLFESTYFLEDKVNSLFMYVPLSFLLNNNISRQPKMSAILLCEIIVPLIVMF